MSVTDTGPGLVEAQSSSGGHGIGLANTRARLEQLYRDQQRFSAGNGTTGGFVVALELPFHGEPFTLAPRSRS